MTHTMKIPTLSVCPGTLAYLCAKVLFLCPPFAADSCWGERRRPSPGVIDMAKETTVILDKAGVGRALTRIAHEILERNKGIADVVLVGILKGGDHLASLLRDRIAEIEGEKLPIGALDVTMYRDDISSRGGMAIGKTEIPFPLDGKKVVLVDDVLYTGRTIRAALDSLMDLGRPQSIQLAVLIDRGHRELPIRPDYIGRNVPTARDEDIQVDFDEQNQPVEVRLAKK